MTTMHLTIATKAKTSEIDNNDHACQLRWRWGNLLLLYEVNSLAIRVTFQNLTLKSVLSLLESATYLKKVKTLTLMLLAK